MLSVGELPTVTRVMKDWRKVHYKDDPMKEQLYREEFMKNKHDLVHPNMFDYLRDERAWRNDEAEHQKHTRPAPSSSSSAPTSSTSTSITSASASAADASQANDGEAGPPHNEQATGADGDGGGGGGGGSNAVVLAARNEGVYSVVGEIMVAESPDFVSQDGQSEPQAAAGNATAKRPPSGLRVGASSNGQLQAREKGLRFHKEEVGEWRPVPSTPVLEPASGGEAGTGSGVGSALMAAQPTRAASKSFLSNAISQWETAMAVGIYVCCTTTTGAKVQPLRVRVPEGATVERVLKEIRKKAGEVGMPFNMDPQAYSLRIAEDDGTPDYDTPQLNADVEVKRFPQLKFCMVDSPLFVKAVASTSTSSGPSVNSSPRLIRVAMGGDQFQTFEKAKDIKVKDILWKVCKKSSVEYTQHALHTINPDEPLPLDMCASDIQADILTLVKKERVSKYRGSRSSSSLLRTTSKPRTSGLPGGLKKPAALFRSQANMLDSKEPSDDEEEEDDERDTPFGKPSFTFWNKEKAFRLKKYEVTKMTKFNIKQERVLGIDRDRITNASKRKSGEPSGGQPTWKFIKNVVDAKVSDTKATQFTLTFEEEGKENAVHTFEALNAQEACEIVEKVKCCKNSAL